MSDPRAIYKARVDAAIILVNQNPALNLAYVSNLGGYHIDLIDSGYQPADQPPYETFHATPENNSDGKYIIDVCVPIIPL